MSVELALAVALVVVCGLWWRDKARERGFITKLEDETCHLRTILVNHGKALRQHAEELEALRSDIRDLRRKHPAHLERLEADGTVVTINNR